MLPQWSPGAHSLVRHVLGSPQHAPAATVSGGDFGAPDEPAPHAASAAVSAVTTTAAAQDRSLMFNSPASHGSPV